MTNMLRILEARTKLPANCGLIPYRTGSTTEKTADGKEEATKITVLSIPVILSMVTAIHPAKNPNKKRNSKPDTR